MKNLLATSECIGAPGSDDSLEHRLAELFYALDRLDINYCILRDYDRLMVEVREKEIDLLMAAHDLGAVRILLGEMEFYEIPAWGHEPHHFFVTYYPNLGLWLKLDVVTSLRFGKPISALQIDYTDAALRQRIKREIGYSLAPEDEFLILLLKSIINDKELCPKRQRRLSQLYHEFEGNLAIGHRIKERLQQHAGDAVSLVHLSSLFSPGDRTNFSSIRNTVVRALVFKQPFRTSWRWLYSAVALKARPLLFLCRKHGVSIALLAPDGAGKSTLAKSLTNHRHLNARCIYMGSNISCSNVGLPSTAWLQRRKEQTNRSKSTRSITRLACFVNRMLEQWYRCAIGTYHVLRGRVVIHDRYIYDSWIRPPDTKNYKKFRRLLIDHSCPTPNLVLLLNAPGHLLYARKGEHSPEALENMRQGYLGLQSRLPNLIVVDATRDTQEVQAEVINLIWKYHSRREFGV